MDMDLLISLVCFGAGMIVYAMCDTHYGKIIRNHDRRLTNVEVDVSRCAEMLKIIIRKLDDMEENAIPVDEVLKIINAEDDNEEEVDEHESVREDEGEDTEVIEDTE